MTWFQIPTQNLMHRYLVQKELSLFCKLCLEFLLRDQLNLVVSFLGYDCIINCFDHFDFGIITQVLLFDLFNPLNLWQNSVLLL